MARPVRRSPLPPLGRWSHHLAWPLAAAFGIYWGYATVGAFRPDYLPAPRYAALNDASSHAPPMYSASQDFGASGCGGDCSDYDLGYRWASVSDADAAAECYDASWSFRRGCLAYLRAEGHFLSTPEPVEPALPELYEAPVYREVGGEVKRDADVADVPPFEGAVLTLATATPTITEHGSLHPPAGRAITDASVPIAPHDASAAPAQPPAPIEAPAPASL